MDPTLTELGEQIQQLMRDYAVPGVAVGVRLSFFIGDIADLSVAAEHVPGPDGLRVERPFGSGIFTPAVAPVGGLFHGRSFVWSSTAATPPRTTRTSSWRRNATSRLCC